jgi:hypothetical protein
MSKCIPVRIDDKLASQLSIWADGRGVPLSQAIRDILSEFVADRVADAIARAAHRYATGHETMRPKAVSTTQKRGVK